MPHKLRIALFLYGGVFAICTGLLIFAAFTDPAIQDKLFPIAEKAFFMALGACLGVLASLAPVGVKADQETR